MRKLLIVLGLAAGLGTVADLAATGYVAGQIEKEASARLDGVGEVSADISSFPFVPRLLVSGKVAHATVRLRDVTEHGIDIAEVVVSVDGLALDRGSVVDGHPRVVDVDLATVAVAIDLSVVARLAAAVGVEVEIDDDQLMVSALGVRLAAGFRVADGAVFLTAGGLPTVRLPLPDADLLPCEPTVTARQDRLRLSCATADLPPLLLHAINNSL